MGYTREKFEVQGNVFQLKPTSPRNVQNLFEYLQDADIEPEGNETDLGANMQALGKQYVEVLFLIADPLDEEVGREDLDVMNIDINQIDAYMVDFMPMQSETVS